MILKDLLAGLQYKVLQGSENVEIDHISWDSRKVKPNTLFICVKGKHIDRHNFSLQAIEAGATVLVVEQEVKNIPKKINVIKVGNTKEAMANIACLYYGNPSRNVNLIGVTGTNGKTSVSWFIAKILETAGRKVGLIGTIENKVGNEEIKVEKLNPTTPDSIELQATFSEMVDEGATDIVMEATSAALINHRVDNCHFNIGVFTNLTQDHLDEHGTMENYKNAKMRLFKMCRYGVINADDRVSLDIKESAECEKLMTFGINKDADLKAEDIKYSLDGVSFTLKFRSMSENIQLRVPGKFSVYNVLAAIGACYFSGLKFEQIIQGVEQITGVKGRFESVPNRKGCLIIVDYAHTPDGLENILTSVKELAKRKIIVVFGCGGDRDRSKRPIMGELAGRIADLCILTSDNPRTEEPEKIIEDIEVGMNKTSCLYNKIVNRKDAIYKALDNAEREDIVVIAGKGHETYQMFENHTIHFDDCEVVREYFEKTS